MLKLAGRISWARVVCGVAVVLVCALVGTVGYRMLHWRTPVPLPVAPPAPIEDLRAQLLSADDKRAAAAARRLGIMAPSDVQAVGALVDGLRPGEVDRDDAHWEILQALGRTGVATAAQADRLINMGLAEPGLLSFEVGHALDRSTEAARTAVLPTLRRALDDEEPGIRAMAVLGLRRAAGDDSALLDRILALAQDRSEDVRVSVAIALDGLEIGNATDVDRAREHLDRLREDREVRVRWAARPAAPPRLRTASAPGAPEPRPR